MIDLKEQRFMLPGNVLTAQVRHAPDQTFIDFKVDPATIQPAANDPIKPPDETVPVDPKQPR